MTSPELQIEITEQVVTAELVTGEISVEVIGEVDAMERAETAIEISPASADIEYAKAFAPPTSATDFLALPEPTAEYWAGVTDQQAQFYLATGIPAVPETVRPLLPRPLQRVRDIEAQARQQ